MNQTVFKACTNGQEVLEKMLYIFSHQENSNQVYTESSYSPPLRKVIIKKKCTGEYIGEKEYLYTSEGM
jgi:hypothetical protein